MSRLGKRQLALMAQLGGVHSYIVVPGPVARSLYARGIMAPGSSRSEGFAMLTPAGYRALADALESGAIKREDLALPRPSTPPAELDPVLNAERN